MQFGKVDIPRDLIEARRKGELVVFAGAGVSVGPPSNLPGFRQLVENVAEGAPKAELKESDGERFDRFLGEIHRSGEGVRVHEIVRREIADRKSAPTALHYELLRLFDSAAEVRLVTTNFDRHFTTAAHDYFDGGVPHYYAPALPPGDDFSGIAYLHGSVEQAANKLVLTDEDFSQAYITKGWARRFLQRLFSNYVVLFVGYSHGEAVIEYLARGLPATDDKGRFALDKGWEDSDDEPTQWEYFEIEPIEYPKAEDDKSDYAELPRALKIWNRYARQTARDRAEHIKTLVDKGPAKLNEQEEDALKDRLGTQQGVRRFADEAASHEWLYWAYREGFLDALFEPGELSATEYGFARWIGSQLVLQVPDSVLSLVGPKANQLNPKFWNRVVRGLRDNNETEALSPDELAEWVQVLLVSPPANLHNLILLLSDGLRMPEDRDSALLLFEQLTEPVADFQEGYSHPNRDSEETEPSARHGVIMRDASAQLPRAWDEILQPHLPQMAGEVEPIATANLRRLYRLHDSVDQTRPNGETPVSAHRSAIEPHPQDEPSFQQEAKYVLIDAARESIEWLLQNHPDRATATIRKWSDSEIPLLERLSVHSMTENPRPAPSAKIRWLLDRDWIYAARLKHEVFRLLGQSYPNADETARKALLERAWQEWPEEQEDDRDRKALRVCNLVYWLADHVEECSLVEERLEIIESEFPEFTPQEHPDLVGPWTGEVQAIQAEDYSEELLRRSPSDQIEQLLKLLKGGWFNRQKDSLDVEDVKTAIAKDFEWGYELMEALADQSEWDEEVWRPVWRGMRETSLEEADWGRLLHFIKDHPGVHSHATGLASLLEQRSKPDTGDLPFEHLNTAERIADFVYEESRHEPITVGGDADLAIKLRNHPGASLAFFSVYALWTRNDVEGLTALPEAYQDRFEKILREENRAAWAGQMVLGSRLSFLHHLAEDWTLGNLLPLFEWNEEGIGRRVWTGLLFMGQSLSPALAQEIKEASRNAFSQASEESDDFPDRFAGFIATLSLSDAIDPLEEQWLTRYLVDAEEDRVLWAKKMRNRLGRFEPDRIQKVWGDWLREYWELRLDGKPPLTSREVGAMVEWIPSLEAVVDEAVALACDDGAPSPTFGQHTQFFHELKEQRFGRHHPRTVVSLLLFVLQEGEVERWRASHYLPEIAEDIADSDDCPSDAFQTLVDLMVELGYLQAEEGDDLIEQC
jgi:hypothetical protein